MGDVVALDPDRRGVQPERLLQALERIDAGLAAALGAQPLLVEREQRVAMGEVEDAALLPRSAGRISTGPSRRLARAAASGCTSALADSSRWTTISAGIDRWPA